MVGVSTFISMSYNRQHNQSRDKSTKKSEGRLLMVLFTEQYFNINQIKKGKFKMEFGHDNSDSDPCIHSLGEDIIIDKQLV